MNQSVLSSPKRVVHVAMMGDYCMTLLKHYLHEDPTKNVNLNLECKVTYSGQPGCTTQRFSKELVPSIQYSSPDIVVLQLGSKDLCDTEKSPVSVAKDIMTLLATIHELNVPHIIVMQILHRIVPRNPAKIDPSFDIESYNSRVNICNSELCNSIKLCSYASWWRHKGLCSHECLEGRFLDDGTSLNYLGYFKFFSNIRAAVVTTIKRELYL